MKKLQSKVVTALAAIALAPMGMAQDGDRERGDEGGRRGGGDKDREHPERMERGEGKDKGEGRERGPRDGGAAEGRRPGGNPFVAMLDIDQNGELSAEEIVMAPSSLAKMDKNNDGKLSKDEIHPSKPDDERERPEGGRPDGERPERPDGERPAGGRPGGDRPEGRPDGDRPPSGGFGDRLKAMDKNENGNLEADEIPEQFRDRMMERMDTDGDSVISKEELTTAMEAMRERFGKGGDRPGGDRARPDGAKGEGNRGGGDKDGGTVKPKRPPLEE